MGWELNGRMNDSRESTAVQDIHFLTDIATFIPAVLDDAGLSPSEFRIYCHLCRRAGRGIGFAGLRSMSTICGLTKQTVITAITSLESKGMISVTREQGEINLYRISPISAWVKLGGLKEGTVGGLKDYPTQVSLLDQGGLKEGTKGSPFKDISDVQASRPETFPPNEVEAVSWASTTGCTPEFIKRVWHKANGRGGRDSRDIPIRNWCSHVMTELAYEKNRVEEQKHRASSTPNDKPPPREKDYSSWSKPTPPGRYK